MNLHTLFIISIIITCKYIKFWLYFNTFPEFWRPFQMTKYTKTHARTRYPSNSRRTPPIDSIPSLICKTWLLKRTVRDILVYQSKYLPVLFIVDIHANSGLFAYFQYCSTGEDVSFSKMPLKNAVDFSKEMLCNLACSAS